MSSEFESRQFRNGESIGKPLGGKVVDQPFAQALYKIAVSRGFETQSSFSRALGKKSNSIISTWYKGRMPTPAQLGLILTTLEPSDCERDALVELYSQLLQEGKGMNGREHYLKISAKNIKSSNTPLAQWMEKFCLARQVTMTDLKKLLDRKVRSRANRDNLSLDTMSVILQKIPQYFQLSEEESTVLSEAVSQTIERRMTEGHRFGDIPGASLKKIQAGLECRTYNGEEAGHELGISRERVSQLRQEMRLPYLLTDVHLEALRERMSQDKRRRRGPSHNL